MKSPRVFALLIVVVFAFETGHTQSSREFRLTEPFLIELNRLEEAYHILDLYAKEVWNGWDDYLSYPVLFTFQNGLRILVGHPSPPPEFVPLPARKVHGLSINIDTTKLKNSIVRQPLFCGGGVLTLGKYRNVPVTIADLYFVSPESLPSDEPVSLTAESTIITFIHELFHCFQPKIREYRYGNLMIQPDLNFALYSDIEGQALLMACEQRSLNESLPFLTDFCVARSYKLKNLTSSERISNSCDEFCEGLAVYSEYTILSFIKNGFSSSILSGNDPYYNHFAGIDSILNSYLIHLKNSAGKTLDVHEKTYWYGLAEALLLNRYFPDWKKELSDGGWLDQVVRRNINITIEDSIKATQRFSTFYHIDSLMKKHEEVLSGRGNSINLSGK